MSARLTDLQMRILTEQWAPAADELLALRTENERLREALKYVLEDDGLLPRATSECRDVVRAALSVPAFSEG
jgi:hypothetical protein